MVLKPKRVGNINAEYRVYSFELCFTGVEIILAINSKFELSNHLLSLNIKLSVAKIFVT